MPPKKSNAEAMRRVRAKIKADPEVHNTYLQNEKQRYQKRKAAGKIKNVNTLSSREQRNTRKQWRHDKREQRRKKKDIENAVKNTPPASPLENVIPEEIEFITPSTSQLSDVTLPSHQKQSGKKRTRKESRKAYRTIQKQNETIKRLQNKIRSLKRYTHKIEARKRNFETMSKCTKDASPATKAHHLVHSGNIAMIRKELTFGFALSKEVKDKIKRNSQKHAEKRTIHKIITGPILAKYRLLHKARNDLLLSQKCLRNIKANEPILQNKRKNRTGSVETTNLIKNYFLQDGNSVATAGKKETLTLKKDKRQKRYLCDTMINLYEKFKSENPRIRISYTSFTRLRPFYVVPHSVGKRDTVKCKLHCNSEFKATKLHGLGILLHSQLSNIMSDIVCSIRDKDCMFGTCLNCKDNMSKMYKDITRISSTETVKYFEWKNVTEIRDTIKGKMTVKAMTKVENNCTVSDLCIRFQEELIKLMSHQYRIFHQYSAIKTIKENMTSSECVLQVDFSENYSCKAATEIQAMHFGGSRKQVSLHTCHATLVHDNGELYTKCYCTLSEDTRHSPIAIWAHLNPVINDLTAQGINTIHFVSDGPTTQYRNKVNFHLLSTLPFQKWNIKLVTWNLLEASHGKGPADGIGAAVKVAADRLVANGSDIMSCSQMFNSLTGSLNVQLYEISPEQINQVDLEFAKDVKINPVKGTMQIHQLISPNHGTYYHRTLSCYCASTADRFCTCHSPEKVAITETSIQKDPILEGVEQNLTSKQIHTFRTRFAEGQDVNVMDLSSLTSDDKKEYLVWKAWRAVKLAGNPNEISTSAKSTRTSDGGALSSTVHQDHSVELHKGNEIDNTLQQIVHVTPDSYYAVFFTQHRKKTFYIGRLIKENFDLTVELKFMERKLLGSEFVYDWPRRDDVCSVNKQFLLKQICFEGPPPFAIKQSQYRELQMLADMFSPP